MNAAFSHQKAVISTDFREIISHSPMPKYANQVLSFHIPPTPKAISLKRSHFFIRGRIVKKQDDTITKCDEFDTVVLENFNAQSMISAVKIYVNDQNISNLSGFYDFEAFARAYTSYNHEELKSILEPAGYDPVESRLENLNVGKQEGIGILSHVLHKRQVRQNLSEEIEFVTPMLEAFFQTDRLIPPFCDIKIEIQLTSPAKMLLTNLQDVPYNFQVLESKFWIKQYLLNSSAENQIQRQLNSTQGYKIPCFKAHSQAYAVEAGSTSSAKVLSRSIDGTDPVFTTCFMLDRTAFEGSMQHPSYQFQHFNLSSAHMEKSGFTYPSGMSYSPKFLQLTDDKMEVIVKADYESAYQLLLAQVPQFNGQKMAFDRIKWPYCCVLYFNQAKDATTDKSCDYTTKPVETPPDSPSTLFLNFRTPLKNSIMIVCVNFYHSELRIDKHRSLEWSTKH